MASNFKCFSESNDLLGISIDSIGKEDIEIIQEIPACKKYLILSRKLNNE